MRYIPILIVVAAFQVQANQSYFLTPEEVEAGFAIRDLDSEKDTAALTEKPEATGSNTATEALGTSSGSTSAGGGGTSTAVNIAAKTKVAMSSAVSMIAAAAPALAKIAVAAAVAVAVTPMVLKVAKGVLAATVTGVCYWLGIPLDWSTTAGLAAPMAVESAGSWLKGKFLSLAA